MFLFLVFDFLSLLCLEVSGIILTIPPSKPLWLAEEHIQITAILKLPFRKHLFQKTIIIIILVNFASNSRRQNEMTRICRLCLAHAEAWATSLCNFSVMLFTLLLPPSGRCLEIFSLICAHQGASQAACSLTDPFGAFVVFASEIPLNKREKKNICYGNQC